ncbi:tRNA/rRNA cytosine-C5-methylase Nol1/Nop2/Sun [Neoasaia chiangmaiensis NBRC 101099]|uniref:rRNA cytosine-C5-methylase n=1 Tax=Neoasaia chiangmaiensis TaxID=320497 RepID=A0A1U9KNJ7_9PROT|nr:RsmB/NOP family class I SAM-dependent RNA methyltransferase [Neoasaia chiangmaiensis]AQS87365.1 rRNA cytosine-C5-methylase [Neoasaia chiangmaiensis]GBR42976.1 tRNA/rRNA cytosine-C5-methylase Nol1/Nop2/Sun [Neoasaia chiangmaiensis NBRC 101099]GEN16126.1 rRNA cytosine-C5-methylase [Neoasaia chiangmaiensis]
MTPAARLSTAIDLLCAIENAPRRPADATANAFFRERRYIGGGDRRVVSGRVWDVLRGWRRLHWHLRDMEGGASPRALCAASLLLAGESFDVVDGLFSGERFAQNALASRERAALMPLEGRSLSDPAMPRAVRLEFPDWLEPYLIATFGDELERELAAMEGAAPLDLRVNLLKTDCEKALSALRQDSLLARPTALSPWGLRLDGRQPVTAAASFREGLVEIQDEGSQLVVAAVDAKPGERVLDFCAGAGGKTLALAMTMHNKGQIVACDVSAQRLEGAVKRLRRAGAHNVERHLLVSGDKWVKRRAGSFDRVLVDAPCSGTGTWRRNPDARIRLTENDISELRVKQAEILDRAASLVKPGGRLVYATCSLLAEENMAQIDAFLSRRADFELAPAGGEVLPEALREQSSFSLTPLRNGTDGFFAAVLRRVNVATTPET